MTDVLEDETYCGPLCQHPSCWSSQRRRARGISFQRQHSPQSKSQSESDGTTGYHYLEILTLRPNILIFMKVAFSFTFSELPTQNIVNLLADYGDDPRDRYPAKYNGLPDNKRERFKTVSAQTTVHTVDR